MHGYFLQTEYMLPGCPPLLSPVSDDDWSWTPPRKSVFPINSEADPWCGLPD